jgi:hypothetical protein
MLASLYVCQITEAGTDPSSWFESFTVDAFACDLNHEPLRQEHAYQLGDFFRICIHTISDESDLIVTGMRYFLLVSEKADSTQEMAELIENNKGMIPSIACSKGNMCVVETILDERTFANGATEIYGYGSLVMGRSNSGEVFSPVDDSPITIRLQQDSNANQEAPNLQGENLPTRTFLRGTTQGA